MTAERWEQVKELLYEVMQLAPEKRTRFLDDACFSDSELRAELTSLRLAEEQISPSFLQSSRLVDPCGVRRDHFQLNFQLTHGPGEAGMEQVTLVEQASHMGRQIAALKSHRFDNSDEFSSTPRFEVQEQLGTGTFGVVYRVLDRQRNSAVALKKLRHFHPGDLLRFKQEFRSLVDLVHPNLVQMYELFGQGREWFFTMELVQGADFLRHVRPGAARGDWDCLRDALCQLAAGIQTLHSSARLHRDLKPSNVLVTSDGRVVILDFGLVKEFEAQSIEQSSLCAGTPAYMAPEQAAGGSIAESSDWYAVGVMLYEAITGQLPFTGTSREVMDRKQRESAPRSRDLASNVPADLDEACQHLLERKPELRAEGAAILHALGRRSTNGTGHAQEDFVGRCGELKLMGQRFSALSSGKRQMVLLHGPSGIGKTSLISHFLRVLKHDHPGAVILKGRCRESESVPYKALDSIADELAQYLRSVAEPLALAFLPRHPGLLRRLFPVFGELEILSAVPDRIVSCVEEQEIRRRAFEALCEMLDRLADRNPVVISIDDLQWGDLDSVAFIAERLIPPNAPAVMLILSFRDEGADRSPALRLLRGFRQQMSDPDAWVDIELSGLSEDEGRDLLFRLQAKRPPIGEPQSLAILRESGGSPLLVSELHRFVSRQIDSGGNAESPSGILLSEMIRYRASTLSSTARQMLEALSVAGEPLSKSTVYRIVEAPDADPSREIWLLLHEHLLRVTGGAQGGELEPFHDQVRQTSLSWLSPLDLQNWHSRLARTLSAEGESDPQRLLRHYRGAGNLPAAYAAASAAAKISEEALAFEQAARFYAEALETGETEGPAQANLYRKRAEALAKAGRGYESAQCYLEAARRLAPNDSLEMQRLAAEQLMRSGHLDEGVQAFTALLRGVGVRIPRRPIQSIIAMLATRAFIRLRGLRWWPRQEADLPAATIRKLDTLWSGALVLSVVNPVFGTWLQARHMLEALRAGEPCRLALSVGLGAGYEARGGAPYFRNGRRLLDFAERIAWDLQNPYVSALMFAYRSVLDYVCGRVEEGLDHSRKAVQMLGELGTPVSWESSTARMLLAWFLGWGGKIREMSELIPGILDEARSRGDVYTAVVMRSFAMAHLTDLAADNPDRALGELNLALEQWSQARYESAHFGATLARTEVDLYAGRIEQARSRVLAEWPALMRSLRLRKGQTVRIMLFYMRGRTALATWLRCRHDRTLVREIEHYASLLTKARSPWGSALGNALRSGVEVGRGRVQDAIFLLDGAEAAFRKHGFHLLAAAVSFRRGELEGESGRARIRAAEAFMRSENIIRPDRMTYMILPG